MIKDMRTLSEPPKDCWARVAVDWGFSITIMTVCATFQLRLEALQGGFCQHELLRLHE
jgi:hypothetical protein